MNVFLHQSLTAFQSIKKMSFHYKKKFDPQKEPTRMEIENLLKAEKIHF